MRPYVVVQNIALPVARLLLVLGAVFAGLGSVAAGGAWAAPAAVGFAVAGLILVRLLRRAERQGLRRERPRGAVRELAAQFWRFSAARGGRGPRHRGHLDGRPGRGRADPRGRDLRRGGRLAIVGAHALQAVGMAMAPASARCSRTTSASASRTCTASRQWWLMALIWPFYLAVAVFAPWIMGLFGPEFVSGADALAILCSACWSTSRPATSRPCC